jgi:uncharacterized protein
MDTSRTLRPRYENVISRLHELASAVLTDRVVIALLAGVALLAVLNFDQALYSIGFALQALIGILPFLVIAVTLAALTRATGTDRLIARAFAGHPARAVIIAALAGALSPFCSCGVVPIIAALLRARVPLAPVMAFWIASPIMDPEMFILTAAGISMEFAAAKTVITILMGLLAGYSIYLLRDHAAFVSPLRADRAGGGCSSALPQGRIEWRFWHMQERRRIFAPSSHRHRCSSGNGCCWHSSWRA